MKFKRKAVTNSSSTSFMFAFKGNTINELFDLMRKNEVFFELSSNIWNEKEPKSCDVDDIIEAMTSLFDSGLDYYNIKIDPIENIIKDRCISEENSKAYMIEDIKRKRDAGEELNDNHYWMEHIIEEGETTKKLVMAKDRGLNSVIVIGFGDNDGHISGGNVGNLMDYVGRLIDLSTPEIMVVTEQDR